MKIKVLAQNNKGNRETQEYFSCLKALLVMCILFIGQMVYAQIGTWTAVANLAPHDNMGAMELLTNGTIMCHNTNGGGYGTGWDLLTPSATGSYVNGTWTSVASMNHDRLFFAGQVLPNGELFVAGGEYGSGDTAGEVYDPLTNVWNRTGGVSGQMNIYDGNSEILPNGKVLVGIQVGVSYYSGYGSIDNQYYSSITNTWAVAPTSPLNHDEAEWLKLPDSSILFVGINGTASCRFRPQTDTWISDNPTPVDLYDPYGEEAGSAVMLPNGKAIFFGATGHNCIYTPTGTTAPGSWVSAADFPVIGGTQTGMVDASSAMMVNGHILCAVSPIGTSSNSEFNDPIYFVEYNYLTNTFTQVTNNFPGLGTDEISSASSYQSTMLDLPNGTVLLAINQDGSASQQYYIYTPGSAAIPQGKPTISGILPDACPNYKITGKLFNGISEGAQYGDDWQMATNYPLVRLTNALGDVYYAKTTDWNRVGAVQTDSLKDTAVFTTPANLPAGTYSLVVVVNGFASNPTIFSTLGGTASVNSEASCGNINGSASITATGGILPYTYLWTGGGGSNSAATQLSAGIYTVTVKDANDCSVTASVVITQSSTLGISANATGNIKCNGFNDGAATASASGGVAPYTYLWAGGKTTGTISGLSAGTYTVSISDHGGCTGTTTVTITQPNLLAVSASVSAEANCNAYNGVAVSNVSGGTPPYSYSWSGGAGTNTTATGLSAGIYTVTVTDNNGCIETASVTITQTTGLSNVSASTISNVKCNGFNNGSATASTTSGTSPYTYSWTGGKTTATISGLSAGTYTVTITDKNGCNGTASTIITQPVALAVSANVATEANCGGDNGSASCSVSGGISPYTYSWTGGKTTATISALSAGIYVVDVTDNNGCVTSASVTITQTTALTNVSANITKNVICNGASDGSIIAMASGGTAPYTYLWPGGKTTATISGLSAGTYSVTITDHNGCTGTASAIITQPIALTVSASTTSSANCGGGDGSASASPSGGTAPYTYLWTGGQTNAIATGLSVGSYTITIHDACGALATASAIVTSSLNTITFSQENAVQNWTIPSGVTQITIALSGAAGANGGGGLGASLTGVCNVTPGHNISVVVGSQGGSSADQAGNGGGGGTFVYDSNTAILFAVGGGGGGSSMAYETWGDPDFGGNGGIDIINNTTTNGIGSNGSAPGGIDSAGGNAGNLDGGVAPGAGGAGWSGNGGSATGAFASYGGYDRAGFFKGGAPYGADVNGGGYGGGGGGGGNGGGGGGGYNGGGGGNDDYSFDGSGGGGGASYLNGHIIGSPSANNSGNGIVKISYPSNPLTIGLLSQSNVLCNGGNNGSIFSNVSGGLSPYTYSWNGGLGTTATVSGLTAGTYTLNVTDQNGCASSAISIITQPNILSVFANTIANTSCSNNTGAASSSANGGTAPYTYSWTGGGTNATISSLSAGTYVVNVTDKNGCTASASVIITQAAGISTVSAIATNVKCNGMSDGSATANVSGGTGPYTYSWQGGGTSATDNGLSAGTYTLTVTDKNGCSGTTSAVITQPMVLAVSTYTAAAANTKDCDGEAAIIANGGVAPYTYNWSPGSQTTDTIKNQCVGDYCCIITDNNGCTESTCVSITANTTGVADISNASTISIYPDPNTGSFKIAGVVQGQVIELYNILGQQISIVTADKTTMYFNISNQTDGIYLVRILNRDGSIVTQKKIIKAQ